MFRLLLFGGIMKIQCMWCERKSEKVFMVEAVEIIYKTGERTKGYAHRRCIDEVNENSTNIRYEEIK